jgi:hypothetical protein
MLDSPHSPSPENESASEHFLLPQQLAKHQALG